MGRVVLHKQQLKGLVQAFSPFLTYGSLHWEQCAGARQTLILAYLQAPGAVEQRKEVRVCPVHDMLDGNSIVGRDPFTLMRNHSPVVVLGGTLGGIHVISSGSPPFRSRRPCRTSSSSVSSSSGPTFTCSTSEAPFSARRHVTSQAPS